MCVQGFSPNTQVQKLFHRSLQNYLPHQKCSSFLNKNHISSTPTHAPRLPRSYNLTNFIFLLQLLQKLSLPSSHFPSGFCSYYSKFTMLYNLLPEYSYSKIPLNFSSKNCSHIRFQKNSFSFPIVYPTKNCS